MRSTVYPFHDGHLMSVAVDDGLVALGLKQADGAAFSMRLSGVDALTVEGFRLGNLILALRAIGGDCPGDEGRSEEGRSDEDLAARELDDAMAALFPAPHGAADAHHHHAHAAFIAGKRERLADGRAVLVALVPAYGAALCAYCQAVDLQRLPTPGSTFTASSPAGP